MMFLVFAGLQIWLAARGNKMTAKNYLEQWWFPTLVLTQLGLVG